MNTTSNVELSVVVPCYDSTNTIEELNERLIKTIKLIDVPYEIIYVNDCSKDNTISILRKIVEENQHVIALDLMYNVGQFKALICGLQESKGKYVVTMDDDLQHPPEEIKKLYNVMIIDSNVDAVIGKYLIKRHSFFRNMGSKFVQTIQRIMFKKPKDLYTSSFRCLNRKLVETILGYKTMYPLIGCLILKSTDRILNVDVHHDERKGGRSNYNLLRLIKTTMDYIFNFSSLPLKYISISGITIFFISVAVAISYLLRFLFGYITIPGWTTVIIMINIYSGLILLSIGIIGEYLIRILNEVNGNPNYVIRNMYRND